LAKIRITKEFKFEAAHVLKGYDGPCRNIHGHSYELLVTVTGEPIPDETSPRVGMVMDFGELKTIVRKTIIDEFDHSLIISELSAEEILKIKSEALGKVVKVNYQPTSENMLIDFSNRIQPLLPTGVKLYSMLLRETVTSYAEWFASDNE
jgi:6-pyruvoyltetrahydropterin/6-carboxytetrahydropterin synthase